jgi:RNA polymerase sigma-70 factor (ECF subfamily)
LSDSAPNLVRKAADGDPDALTELLRIHGPAVERSLQIGKIWQNVLEPSDVMQVTYLEAFLRIRTFDPNRADSFEPWLKRIAQNNLKDAIRGLERQKQPQPKNRVQPTGYEDSLVGLYNLLGHTSTTPSLQVRRQEACSLMQSAIDELPDRYAEVIRQYDLEGKPITEVAQAVGKSTGAVHMIRARAHDRLREVMGSSTGYL